MKHLFLVLSLLWSFCVGFFYPITATAQTVEDFAKLPFVSSPRISPNGQYAAYVTILNDTYVIVTKDLEKPEEKYMGLIPLRDVQLSDYVWASNDRLIVTIRGAAHLTGVGKFNMSRMFAVDKTGQNVMFFEIRANRWGLTPQHPAVIHLLPNDPDHVLMELDPIEDSWNLKKVHKVNIYNGKKSLVDFNHDRFFHLLADNKGNIRIGVKLRDKNQSALLFYRETAKDSWSLIQREKLLNSGLMSPIRFDYENDNILIFASEELSENNIDEDQSKLWMYDLKEHKIIGPYEHSYRQTAKASLEKAFPGQKVRLIDWANNITLDKAFYEVYSDVSPPQYFLYDLKSKTASYFGSEYPQLENSTLHPMQELSYKARDGLNIPTYFTLPAAYKDKAKPKLPLIVYPHGGPWARDYWGFDNYVQFFAHEGYAVFQPQFRGSIGFGIEHEEAGYQQWGTGIQNDIIDGVHWLIAEGIADPERICIVGSSFGGYAAMLGLAQNPELFKCGISINGVMDLEMHRKSLGKNLFSELNKEILNPKSELKKVSPYHLSKKIKAPTLLMAGDKDTVVDPSNSKKMFNSLKKQKTPVELIMLPNGEHWRTIESNEITKLKAMQTFLREHLKPVEVKTPSEKPAST